MEQNICEELLPADDHAASQAALLDVCQAEMLSSDLYFFVKGV